MRILWAVAAYWTAIAVMAAPCFAQTPEPSLSATVLWSSEKGGVTQPPALDPPPVDLNAEQPPPAYEGPTGENPPPSSAMSPPPSQDEANRALLNTPLLKESWLEDWGQAIAKLEVPVAGVRDLRGLQLVAHQ